MDYKYTEAEVFVDENGEPLTKSTITQNDITKIEEIIESITKNWKLNNFNQIPLDFNRLIRFQSKEVYDIIFSKANILTIIISCLDIQTNHFLPLAASNLISNIVYQSINFVDKLVKLQLFLKYKKLILNKHPCVAMIAYTLNLILSETGQYNQQIFDLILVQDLIEYIHEFHNDRSKYKEVLLLFQNLISYNPPQLLINQIIDSLIKSTLDAIPTQCGAYMIHVLNVYAETPHFQNTYSHTTFAFSLYNLLHLVSDEPYETESDDFIEYNDTNTLIDILLLLGPCLTKEPSFKVDFNYLFHFAESKDKKLSSAAFGCIIWLIKSAEGIADQFVDSQCCETVFDISRNSDSSHRNGAIDLIAMLALESKNEASLDRLISFGANTSLSEGIESSASPVLIINALTILVSRVLNVYGLEKARRFADAGDIFETISDLCFSKESDISEAASNLYSILHGNEELS